MPLSLWGGGDDLGDAATVPGGRKLPTLQAVGVTWILHANMFTSVFRESDLLRKVQWMKLVECWENFMGLKRMPDNCGIVWPQSLSPIFPSSRSFFEAMLSCLNFVNGVDVHDINWPNIMKRKGLSDMDYFSILHNWADLGRLSETSLSTEDRVFLPSKLKQLTLEWSFESRAEWISLPVNLEELSFGNNFNQLIDSVVCPPLVKGLKVGNRFNKPIVDVGFPASLHRLLFGHAFNQQVSGVV